MSKCTGINVILVLERLRFNHSKKIQNDKAR